MLQIMTNKKIDLLVLTKLLTKILHEHKCKDQYRPLMLHRRDQGWHFYERNDTTELKTWKGLLHLSKPSLVSHLSCTH